MSTSPHVLDPTLSSAGSPAHARLRGRWLIGAIAGAAIAAGVALLAGPSDSSPPPTNVAGDAATGTVPAIEAANTAPLGIDHSAVESKSLVDEPDMTGASIGTYAP
jgi:hypothetical protein